jgi:hypothetical protein
VQCVYSGNLQSVSQLVSKTSSTIDYRDEVRAHVTKHLGPISDAFRDAAGPGGIEILHVPPQDTRPVRTLVTCGMSDRAMSVPSGKNAPRYIELMVTLPRTWSFDEKARQDPRWSWPMSQLRSIAQLPRTANRWIGWGETIANGAPARQLGPNTKLCGAVIVPSLLVPQEFYELKIAAHSIAFFSVLPLYKEELELKEAKGVNHLFETLLDAGIKDFIDPRRKNVARKKLFGIF